MVLVVTTCLGDVLCSVHLREDLNRCVVVVGGRVLRGWGRRSVCDPMCACVSLHFVAGSCLTRHRCVECLPARVDRVVRRLACIVWDNIMLLLVCLCVVLVRALASFINLHCYLWSGVLRCNLNV